MGRPKRYTRVDEFADMLAAGMTIDEASAGLGVSRSYGDMILYRIRKRLGWQAQ